MTDHEYDLLAWTLITIAWLILAAGIAEQVIQHVREERDQKPRPLPGALGASMEARIEATWPAWDPADELAAQVFHSQLADDARIWRKVEGER